MKSFKSFYEDMTFKVEIEGLPALFMAGNSPGQVKNHLRKLIKQPSMIKGVERQTKHDVKKMYRKKAQGKEVDEMTQQSKELPNLKIAVGTSAQKAKAAAERSAKRKNNRKGTHLAAQYESKDISELSPATVKSYKKKASDSNYAAAQRYARVAASPTSRKYKNKEMDRADNIGRKRKAGLAMADKKEGSCGDVDYGSDKSIKIMKKKTPGETNEKLTIGKIRRAAYKTGKVLGDVNAVKRGKVAKRVKNRLVGKLLGKAVGKMGLFK